MLWTLALVLLQCIAAILAHHESRRPYELIVHREPDTLRCTYLALRDTQLFKALPAEGYVKPRRLHSGEERIQYIAHEEQRVWEHATALCGGSETWDFPALLHETMPPSLSADQVVLRTAHAKTLPVEIEPLITSGDSSNRIDLVFFADGYTSEERGKFIADALRLAKDISGNQTFYTVKPLLNFWAAFTPSRESGIGTGGLPKDTTFGLYRDGTELRSVWYSKPEVARRACFSLGDQCDYPILMGNDPLYGGLGGEFTVITPSLANGALVLRHELGHSIIDVGEEYDGAEDIDYFGVNTAQESTVPWAHWLTHPAESLHGSEHPSSDHPTAQVPRRVERAAMPLQEYAWAMLNTSAPWTATFESAGTYAWHLVRFSLSGVPHAEDLRVELDGKDLGWVPREDIGVDRWHYDIRVDAPLQPGRHQLTFKLESKEAEGQAQLCSVEIIEFGDEDEFVATPGHYGLYPTFSEKNATTYRPTNEDCLMRIVTTPNFCKACTEGLWHALLRRVTLIDALTVGCAPSGFRTFDLALVPLAHLRERPVGVRESYEITWLRDGVEVPEWKNQTSVADGGSVLGIYAVEVRYWTEEVRVDPNRLLESAVEYVVTTRCT